VHGRVSYLPGEVRLPRGWRGRDVLRFFSQVRGDDSYALGLRMAERLDLALEKPVTAMSTGTRQKLALVAALAPRTPVVILDEPTGALDPTVRAEVLAVVREARGAGRTVLFSSHVMSEVEEVCDRVAILRGGELVHLQNILELRRQHRIRARLVGPLPPLPAALLDQLDVAIGNDGAISITTPGELSPLLAWLATLPLAEVQIEPVGLRAIYDRFHPALRGN
jgi:ABC-2 type transport system ATP-binding protein